MLLGIDSVVCGVWYGIVKLCGDGVLMRGDVSRGCSVVWCKALCCDVGLCVVGYRVRVML